jgi:hypothetical protein
MHKVLEQSILQIIIRWLHFKGPLFWEGPPFLVLPYTKRILTIS